MDFDIVNMNPDGRISSHEPFEIEQSVTQQCQPNRMLQVILIRPKSFLSIEWRINIDQLNVAGVLLGKLGHAR